MHIANLIALAATAAAAPAQLSLGNTNTNARETFEEAVLSTANLAKHITTGTMSSVFPPGSEHAGQPYALMESHAPCHSGASLTFITMPISLTTRNILASGGHATYTLQTPLKAGVSEYAQPRAAYIGNLTVLDVTPEEDARLRECYVKYHPDARWWLPADPRGAHSSHWARLDVLDIYYIGGFGNTGWIGHIPADKFGEAMDA